MARLINAYASASFRSFQKKNLTWQSIQNNVSLAFINLYIRPVTINFQSNITHCTWGATQEHLRARNHSQNYRFDRSFYRVISQNSRKLLRICVSRPPGKFYPLSFLERLKTSKNHRAHNKPKYAIKIRLLIN